MEIASSTKYNLRLLVIILSTLILLLLFPTITHGSLSGSLENDLDLKPGISSLITYKSELDVTYRLKGMVLSSHSVFREDSYYSQLFGTGFRVGMWDIDSTLSFHPQDQRLNYVVGEAGLTLGGVGIDNTFVLEYLEGPDSYGSGYKLTFYGQMPNDGPKVYVKNLFGMEENEAELLGLEDGSGYTIPQSATYGPSQWQYVSTTVELTGIDFSCCDFTSTTKLSEEKGFEYTILEFDIEEETYPLKLYGELKFTPQTKSVKLHPRLDLDWACFDVYTDLSTADDENVLTVETGTIGGLIIKGFGITGINLGNVHLSSLTALQENLFRPSTEKNIDLHANDYVLSPDPVYSGLYTETDYDEVISIVSDFETVPLTIGLDTYFDSTDKDLFGFGLFTGTGQYRISDQFNLSVGIEVNPDSLERVRLGFDYYF